jgi:[ribosomal protein S5]-alanine N-acetyltransferase
MRAPEHLTTTRLVLRRPVESDASDIFERYASDPEVTRFLGWPRHRSVEDARAFIQMSDQAWSMTPAGPYLVHDAGGKLLGSTGLDIETPWRAGTGFVLARSEWGRGYATEIALLMVDLAARIGLTRLYAFCFVDNRASARVLRKAGFVFEGVLRGHMMLPNLNPDRPSDVESWALVR